MTNDATSSTPSPSGDEPSESPPPRIPAALRSDAGTKTTTTKKTKRKHPAKGARAAALVASLAATGGVAGAMVVADAGSDAGAVAAPFAAPPAAGLPALPASASSGGVDCIPAALGFYDSGYDDHDSEYDDDYEDEDDHYEDDHYENDDYEDDDYEDDDYGPAFPAPSADCVAPQVQPGAGTGVATTGGGAVFLGTAERTEWGNVQVEVRMVDGAISDIAAVQIPNSDRRSARLSAGAEPILEADAIAGQDANLDIVSGATYTSRSYARSLQAALDQAALVAQTTAATPASGMGA